MNAIIIILSVLVMLVAVLLYRASGSREQYYDRISLMPDVDINPASAAKKLSGAVKIKTIGYDDISKTDMKAFRDFAAYLQKSFPGVHRVMKREVINGASLLYRWKGKDQAKKPALFCAHMDVVPVEQGTDPDWKYPPFSGTIAGDAVWGRGTQDIKNQLVTLLEAAELMIRQKFVPDRDIYFAFGHDEETRRYDGADVIAAKLKERGIAFEYVLDEGGCVIDNGVAGISRPVAFIGIAEKGFVNIKITTKGEGGHSSMPPEHTAAGIAGLAVAMLEKHKRPLKLTSSVREMFRALSPAMGFASRLFLENLWIFAPLFKRVFAKTPSGAAFLRTTMAPTMLEGSGAPNVLPLNASAVVNARILHGETSQSLKAYIEKVIGDKTVTVEMNQVYEPSRVSPVDSYGYRSTACVIRTLWPEAVIAPYLVVGGTDGRKYEELTDCVYRFTPMRLENSEMKQMHGTNEHISIKNLEDAVRFYTAMFTV